MMKSEKLNRAEITLKVYIDMNEENTSFTLPCLSQMNFHLCSPKEFLSPAGYCFEPDPELGSGYYWYYEKPGMFAIGIFDLRTKEDYILEYQQPDFISVNYYDSISAEELSPYKKFYANCIRGHVSDGTLYRARYHKNMPLKGVELSLMPGYYHDYLELRYPGEFPDAKKAFRSIDGSTDFPELTLILKQIQRFQGSGAAAELYYESKITEALSLIIERTRESQNSRDIRELTDLDIKNLEAVRSYIEDHFAYEIRSEQLASIACMGQTKLRASFKQAYGCTITEYIQNRRLTYAEYLLLKTDFNISQIAEAVGYHHSGRFSGLFKKNTGLLPDEYRKIMK